MASDPDLIACLYPFGEYAERSLEAIELPDNAARYTDAVLPLPKGLCNSRETSEEPDDDGDGDGDDNKDAPSHDYRPKLQLRFGQNRKYRAGFTIGTSSRCDIRLPTFSDVKGLSSIQCAISFDSEGRLVLRDLRDPKRRGDGTAVTYDSQGGEKRRGFTWILGGHRALDNTEIVILFHNKIQFLIVVPYRDFHSVDHKKRIDQFRLGANASVSDLVLSELSFFGDGDTTEVPTGAQTPRTNAILLQVGPEKLGQGTFGTVTHVWDVSTGREFARKDPVEEEYRPEDWAREINLMSTLNHVCFST